jgi:cell division protease FtsH
VKRVIDDAFRRAKSVLTEHLDLLHKVAQSLLERETLTRDDIELLRKGQALPPRQPAPPLPPTPVAPPPITSTPKPSAPPLLGEPGVSPA